MFLELATLPSIIVLHDPAIGVEPGEGPRTNASCDSDFEWARSSVGTPPCLIAAEVLGACNDSNWNLPSLLDGMHYPPPDTTTANPCFCSWSAYNLLGACSACQGYEDHIYDWATYRVSCSSLGLPDIYYPKTMSSPVLIPYWATLDPAVWPEHRFNVVDARFHSSQNFSDFSPRVPNWQSSMVPSSGLPTPGTIGSVVGILGGLAGTMLAIDLVLYMIYHGTRNRNNHAGGGAHHAIALTPPPHRRQALTSSTSNPPRGDSVSGRTHRIPFTSVFV